MCGRYSIINDLLQIRTFFSIGEGASRRSSADEAASEFEWSPRYNAAPSQLLPVVVADADGVRRMDCLRWGLVPSWAKPEDVRSVGAKMINARSETVAEKPSFRQAFVRRRCLVPANSFYEWKSGGGSGKAAVKTPQRIFLKDQPLFAFAGIHEEWVQRGAAPAEEHSVSGGALIPARLRTFSILTTEANEFMAGIHSRMPVILPSAVHDQWLDPSVRDSGVLLSLLETVKSGPSTFEAQAVSRWINSPSHEGPDCWRPDEPSEQGGLPGIF